MAIGHAAAVGFAGASTVALVGLGLRAGAAEGRKDDIRAERSRLNGEYLDIWAGRQVRIEDLPAADQARLARNRSAEHATYARSERNERIAQQSIAPIAISAVAGLAGIYLSGAFGKSAQSHVMLASAGLIGASLLGSAAAFGFRP